MRRTDEIFLLVRDIVILGFAGVLVLAIARAWVPSAYVPAMVPLILGLLFSPTWLRADRHRRQADDAADREAAERERVREQFLDDLIRRMGEAPDSPANGAAQKDRDG